MRQGDLLASQRACQEARKLAPSLPRSLAWLVGLWLSFTRILTGFALIYLGFGWIWFGFGWIWVDLAWMLQFRVLYLDFQTF